MQEEQLLSWVRYERSRLTGYAALDEILTIVVEAKERVADAEKQVRTYEAKLKGLEEVESKANREHALKVAALYEELAQRKVEADVNHDKALEQRKVALAKLDQAISEKQAFYDAVEHDCEVVAAKADDLVVLRADLESDVNALRKQLQDIKESIR